MIPILKGIIKYGLSAIVISYLTFQHADRLQNFTNTLKYSFVETEQGYVKKEQALDLKIKYERNGKNNLETYLKTYNQKLPIYERQNGLIVGDATYIFSNLTNEEKIEACSGLEKPKKKLASKSDKIKKFFYDIYKNLEDEKDE